MKSSIRAIALGLCATAIFLSAVGSASATEPSWHVESSNNPFEATNILRDVACPKYEAPVGNYVCFEVGNSTTASGSKPLIEWGLVSLGFEIYPTPSTAEYPGAVLEAISCSDEVRCTAVGYYTPKAGTRRPFAERWDGTKPAASSWSIEKPAIPGTDEFTELTGVSCASAISCEAVGMTKATSGTTASKPLTEKWNGSTWTVQTSYSPGGVEPRLSDVSCTSSTSCIAVGSVNGTVTLGESYNGTEWKQAGLPTNGVFEGVSCTASNACTAVGQWSKTAPFIIARRWNGAGWAPQTITLPPGATASVGSDVSCASATQCVAVGGYTIEGASHALAYRWNGTAWSQDSVPAPAGSSATTLLGVVCQASPFCAAVGDATVSGAVKTLVETYR